MVDCRGNLEMWKSVMRFCFDIVVEVRKCGHLSLMS